MCELLGMSANVPTDIRFSFTGLVQRGGRTGPHRDGWGIGLYESRACRMFHDAQPSVSSEIAQLVQRHALQSRIVISHIRRATRGRVCLENTHPFARELWGRSWVFAHNGELKTIKRRNLSHYQPIGTTDSEHAFCWMMDGFRECFPRFPRRPELLWRCIAAVACELDTLGTFNFLMSDSRYLYAYCSTRLCWITRRHPFGEARLLDAELSVDFSKETTTKDVVSVIATRCLTGNESWQQISPKTLLVFDRGEPVSAMAGD